MPGAETGINLLIQYEFNGRGEKKTGTDQNPAIHLYSSVGRISRRRNPTTGASSPCFTSDYAALIRPTGYATTATALRPAAASNPAPVAGILDSGPNRADSPRATVRIGRVSCPALPFGTR